MVAIDTNKLPYCISLLHEALISSEKHLNQLFCPKSTGTENETHATTQQGFQPIWSFGCFHKRLFPVHSTKTQEGRIVADVVSHLHKGTKPDPNTTTQEFYASSTNKPSDGQILLRRASCPLTTCGDKDSRHKTALRYRCSPPCSASI